MKETRNIAYQYCLSLKFKGLPGTKNRYSLYVSQFSYEINSKNLVTNIINFCCDYKFWIISHRRDNILIFLAEKFFRLKVFLTILIILMPYCHFEMNKSDRKFIITVKMCNLRLQNFYHQLFWKIRKSKKKPVFLASSSPSNFKDMQYIVQ